MLHAHQLFDGFEILRDCRVEVADGRVVSVEPNAAPRPGDAVIADGLLVPGLVDLQINGFAGVDFAVADAAGLASSLTAVARTGTTSCLPTIITAPIDELVASLGRLQLAQDGTGARILGVHVEGPFISERRKGAHRADVMCDPTPEAIGRLAEQPALTLLTLAPERRGGMEAIEALARAGVLVSIGHTDATAAQVHEAAARGASMVTHLFNAQRPIGHREPGVAGAALVDERLALGLIVDLHHVAPDMVRLTFAAAAGRVVLVTDALASAGMPPGIYELGGESIVIDEADEPARRLDGTLSGSGLTLAVAVRNSVDLGIPLVAALASATSIPAARIGRADVGVLRPGALADLAHLDDALHVRQVWMGGAPVSASA
jgi:N-acetylglucosamine-6-phosphate deacetylase